MERKNFDKAIQFLTKSIELNPEDKDAYAERAEVYRLMGEVEKAEADEEMVAKL